MKSLDVMVQVYIATSQFEMDIHIDHHHEFCFQPSRTPIILGILNSFKQWVDAVMKKKIETRAGLDYETVVKY